MRIFASPVTAAILAMAVSPLASAQSPGRSASTLVTVENSYDLTGAIVRSDTSRQAWRADGSTAMESSVVSNYDSRPFVSILVCDLQAGRETRAFPALGVKIVDEIPAPMRKVRFTDREACLDWVRFQGEQVGDNPFVRRRTTRDGKTAETRFEPEIGCQATEYRLLEGDRVRSEKRVVRRIAAADETLFQGVDGLRAVSRVGWAEARQRHFGRPISSNSEFVENLRQMDIRRPVVELKE